MKRIDPKTFGRKHHRHKLFEPASITVSGAPRRAHLLNLSTTGALVHCGDPLWIDDEKRFGVRFREPVQQSVIDALLRPPTAGR